LFNFMGLTGLMEAGAATGGEEAALVFHWHGTGMPASMMLGVDTRGITSKGGVVISPDGPAAGEAGALCSGTLIFGDAVTWDIVDQFVACAVRDHNINPRRIYAVGCSAGGLQSGCMAARRSSYVAAVAPNSGGVTLPLPYQDPAHIPAVFAMHGGPGDTVVINFGDASRSLATMTKNAGGFAVECNHGIAHCMAPADLHAAAFEFLYAHPFGIKPSPYAGGLPPNFPSYCQIF
jgi:poly(3-hydroxybutyrate) depolymerase